MVLGIDPNIAYTSNVIYDADANTTHQFTLETPLSIDDARTQVKIILRDFETPAESTSMAIWNFPIYHPSIGLPSTLMLPPTSGFGVELDVRYLWRN